MRLAIGVMGSSSGVADAVVEERLVELGRAVAEHGCTLITGACPSLPYAAVRGANSAHGLVVGISPGLSRDEHLTKYQSPVEGFDVIIFTGSGLMGREVRMLHDSGWLRPGNGRGNCGTVRIKVVRRRWSGGNRPPACKQRWWELHLATSNSRKPAQANAATTIWPLARREGRGQRPPPVHLRRIRRIP